VAEALRGCAVPGLSWPRREDTPQDFDGTIIITWPQPQSGSLHGWAITITDPVTGEPVNTVMGLTAVLHASAESIVWAECEMLADKDGNPLSSGLPSANGPVPGEVMKGIFRYLVTEMRVTPPAEGADGG
jgi:hypothetical protein